MDTTDGHLIGTFTMPTTPTPAPAQPTHNHQWQPHYATRVVQEAYDEEVTHTVQRDYDHLFANWDPSFDLTQAWMDEPEGVAAGRDFMGWMQYHGYPTACFTQTVTKNEEVTETVHHPAVTEQYIDYYFCADDSCGERHTPAELGKPDK